MATTDRYRVIYGPPKSDASVRVIDLDAETVMVLRAWRKVQMAEQLVMGAGWQDTMGLVFTLADGSPLHPNTVGKVFDRIVRNGGLPKIALHGLRHGHATHQLLAGAQPHEVSARLGHASVSFTLQTYAHVLPGRQAEAAERVAKMVDGAGPRS